MKIKVPRSIALLATENPTEDDTAMSMHYCAPAIHPEKKEVITNYKKFIKDPIMREVWEKVFGKEFGNLAQDDNLTGEKGTNSIFVMMVDEINNILNDRMVTYTRIVVDYRPHKKRP